MYRCLIRFSYKNTQLYIMAEQKSKVTDWVTGISVTF